MKYDGWALFLDSDMLFKADIKELWDLRNDDYAVMVCQHDYIPKQSSKFLNQIQTVYEKKNWSSLMLMNTAKCKQLTKEYVNEASGLELHQFKWTDKVGGLPLEWNWLVGEYPLLRDGRLHPERVFERHRRGLLAENRLLRRGGRDHDLAVSLRRRDHHDGIDIGIRHEVLVIRIRLRHAEFEAGRLDGVGPEIGNSRQGHAGHASREVATVGQAHPTQAHQADINFGFPPQRAHRPPRCPEPGPRRHEKRWLGDE